MRKRRLIENSDTGSIADISFLLLVFFMVVTTFHKSYKIEMTLPPQSENEVKGFINKDRLLNIYLNTSTDVLVENNLYPLEQLKLDEEMLRITSSTKKGIIKINMLPETHYETYLKLLAKIKESKQRIYNKMSQTQFNTSFTELTADQKTHISKMVSYSISEQEINQNEIPKKES